MGETAPSWLNHDLLQDVLRRSESDNSIQVTDMSWKSATNRGDNYSSDILRIFVEFSRKQGEKDTTEKKSLILKLAPTDDIRKDLITQFGVFDKEIDFMTNMLKKINQLLDTEHLGRLGPTALHVKKEFPSFLIIEDLAPLGFRMANRESGLDLEHCILAMRNIARFHACAAVICEKEPEYKELYKRGMFSRDVPSTISKFFTDGAIALAKEVESWPELGKGYADKIRSFASRVYDLGLDSMNTYDDEFNTITHGDAWVNNMLFRYNDEGKPIEHIFVDFQISAYKSPAIDLHYFLNTGPKQEVFEESREYLLEEYVHTLRQLLSQLGYKGTAPTIGDIKRYMKRRQAYGVITAFSVLPVVLTEKEHIVDLDELLQIEGAFEHPAYKGQTYRKVITKRILYFEKIGALDEA